MTIKNIKITYIIVWINKIIVIIHVKYHIYLYIVKQYYSALIYVIMIQVLK